MKKIILAIVTLISLQVKSQINVSESFETGTGNPQPTGFTSTTSSGSNVYAPFDTYAGTACDGNKEIAVALSFTGVNTWYLTYSSTASNGNALNYSFSYLAKPATTNSSAICNFHVQYSINDGSTWTNLQNLGFNYATGVAVPCTTVSGTIPAGVIPAGASFKFRLNSSYVSPASFWMGYDNLVLSQSTLGTEDFNDKIEIKAYPNPFKDIISITNINDVESVTVIDTAGKIIETYVDPSQNLDLRELKSGMYFINIKMKDGTSKTVKSIKK